MNDFTKISEFCPWNRGQRFMEFQRCSASNGECSKDKCAIIYFISSASESQGEISNKKPEE